MPASLPLVDIAALTRPEAPTLQRQACGQALLNALSEVGFVVIQGHGVPKTTLGAMRNSVELVFRAPRETLMAQKVEKSNYRGYVPLGYFTPNSGQGKADLYEAWKLHTETPSDDPICAQSPLYGPNRWPAIGIDVRTPVLAYWSEMDRVNHALLVALCNALALDADLVTSWMRQPLTNMTLLHYPPAPAQSDLWGIHPHKDFNFLTLLAHDPVGGLQVRDRQGDWIDATCPSDAYVVNVGDMLELLTGGRLVSTPHRVVNRSGRQRFSFPYFSVPRHDVDIAPLLPALPGFDRPSLNAGRSSADIWYSNWPDERSVEPGQVLGQYD